MLATILLTSASMQSLGSGSLSVDCNLTGATSQKTGRMELADQGALFLDEVGDIPVEIQPKLLRALQEREFERLGSTHTRRVNVAPLGELRKASEVRMAPHRVTHEAGKADSEAVNSPIDKSSIAVQYANRQREEILSALTAYRGRVGGADGAAARLGINRTTLLSRMKKFAIYAKQFS